MGKALEWLGGSVLVYAVVAACSGGAERSEPIALDVDSGAGSGGMMGSGGTGSNDSGLADVVGDVMDAMVNPVPDADAQTATPGWEAVEVPCNQGPFNWFSTGYQYGEVLRPGRSAADLARTVVTYEYPQDTPDNQKQMHPPGMYDRFTFGNAMVRDGAVGSVCIEGSGVVFTFLIPPPV